ncbi:MAG: cytochrome c biogenesis protein CcdA [Verrucomicrobiaceae bacterium]
MPLCLSAAKAGVLWLLFAPNGFSHAQVLDAGPEIKRIEASELNPKLREAAATLDAIRDEEKLPGAEKWAVVCEACGLHVSLRAFAAQVKPFPAMITAGLLTHPKFAVRMGALEILEERTGKDSNFDPWEPQSDESKAALKFWLEWATKQEGGKVAEDAAPASPAADEAKMRGYLVDLAGADVSKQERAFESLAQSGMTSVAFLEQYLHDTPQLADGVRSRIKQAQYRLVLRETFPKDAARIARDLVYGTRDQKLAAMQPLPRCREKAVPILAEYLADSDALIREAAMDALILAGGEAVYDLVQERLKVETDENVIHAVLRRVSTQSDRGSKLIASFMTSKNEDLVVAALNALSDGKSHAGQDGVMACIDDPRWRVRVAALEYAGKLNLHNADDKVIAAFSDKDEFVRYAAMKAAADMSLESAVPLITKMALADDTLLGPATDAIVRMGRLLPDELVDALPKKNGEALLGVLRAFGKRAGHDGEHIEWHRLTESNTSNYAQKERATAEQALKIVRLLSDHRDPDVRGMAVQFLAGILLTMEDRRLVYDALKKADADGRITILESMEPGPFDFRESLAAEPEEGETTTTGDGDDIFARVLREPPPRNEAQEAVYAAFGVKLEKPPPPAPPTAPGERSWQPMEKEFHDLLVEMMTQRDNAELAFLAAAQLAFGGQKRAISEIHQMLPRLEPHQRARLGTYLNMDSKLTELKAGMALLRSLLQDESPEVRGDAVYATLRKDSPERVRLLLEEVNRPDGHLKAVNAYNYSLANATEQPRTRSVIEKWSLEVLGNANAKDEARTLALVLLGSAGKDEAADEAVKAARSTANVWQRRAAWRALMHLDHGTFDGDADKVAGDSSPLVREVLAAAYMKSDRDHAWRVWFGERDWEEESMPYRQRSKNFGLPETIKPLVTKLAADSSPLVRLKAMMTLISHGEDADPLSMREALATLNEEDERRELLEPFLEQSYRQLSPRYGFVLDYVQKKWFDDRTWKSMQSVLNPDGGTKSGQALTSFASLVSTSTETASPVKTHEAAPKVAHTTAATNVPLRVLFFHKPGCKDCERVRDMLRVINNAQPLDIVEYNIERSEGAEINQTLCVRFQVEPQLQQVTPAVFTQAGALVKTQVTYNALQRLIEKTSELPVDADWSRVDEKARASAGGEIAERFSSFSIGWVALAGLLDGINPCAFATIIFFLSYLRVARRSPREILMVGMAFIAAVFIAYFAVGLGLSQLVAKLEAFAWVRTWLNRLLALVALVLAWLSFRDGLKALRGRIEESTLQLPEFLKTRIRSVIRVQTRSTHFIVAAFASGIVISLLELACTGQVYLPTIVYMMKQGSLTAVGYLLLYNIAFVVPLIAIFVLAWLGMTSDALIEFQKKHTAAVRFATALLFLALWIVLLVA